MRRQGLIISTFILSLGGCETPASPLEKAVFPLCVPDSCADAIENGDETDVDCGGSCIPCDSGKDCETGADCKSNVCTAGVCAVAACTDGVANGDETGVDCGGSCDPCNNGESCDTDVDCIGLCNGNVCEAPLSCDELHTRKPALGDGAYSIAPAGVETPFQAYCDMTRDGGGWTLLLKADGSSTLGYNASYWTDNNLLNEADVTLSAGNAKYESFLTVPVTTLRGELDGTRYTMTQAGDMTAKEIFSGAANIVIQAPPINAGNWSYQPYCHRFGVNTPYNHNRTRFGWLANNEQNCNTCDTSIGLGLTTAYSSNNDRGAGYECLYTQCSQGNVNTGGSGRLWAR